MRITTRGGVVSQLLENVPLPRMFRARQTFPRPVLTPEEIPGVVRAEMSREECGKVLGEAFGNQRPVAVQLKEVDENGDRPEEIVDFVQGYAEDKVVIGEHVIALDDLRCVLLLSD